MDEQLKKSRKAFETYVSPDKVFTEEDKKRIRDRIQSAPVSMEGKKRAEWFPKLMTGGVAAAVICFLAIFIGSALTHNLGSSDKSAESSHMESADDSGAKKGFNPEGADKKDTSNELTDDAGRVQLEPELLSLYKQFSAKHDDMLLRGLTPLQIFTLYFYAEDQKDYGVQYWLFNHDPDVEQIFKSEEDWIQSSQKDGGSLLEKVKNSYLEEKIVDDSNAYILISSEKNQGLENSLGFGLSKNKAGVWKVNWMPIQ
ncbi:hypothetical protein [Falsibacillus pallidus]|uniref:Uncharacterized protein n=1 Tax=Falsibacillus pallidus TaxID=493781 RepID=A0A370GPY9_9BACI|nr:hypothetical protein [Falsibacillus pallidus]RDI45785.1 hypothetical protein DFR59_102419 [Falsibacillus pallidus]